MRIDLASGAWLEHDAAWLSPAEADAALAALRDELAWEQREIVLADVPGTLDTLVDEMLRYVSPVMYFRRTALIDTELRDVPIREGDKVTVWYGAANFSSPPPRPVS